MIAQHQLPGVGLEIVLAIQGLDVEAASVVADQRDGHAPGNQPAAIRADEAGEFTPGEGVEALVQLAGGVLENGGVATAGGGIPRDGCRVINFI